jgi:hypothetical protein
VERIPEETKSVGSLFFGAQRLRHPLSVAWRRTLIRGFPLTEVPPIVHPGPDRRRSGRVEPQGLAWTERSWLGSLLIQGFFHRTPNSFPVCPCTFPTGRAPCPKTPPEDVPEPTQRPTTAPAAVPSDNACVIAAPVHNVASKGLHKRRRPPSRGTSENARFRTRPAEAAPFWASPRFV